MVENILSKIMNLINNETIGRYDLIPIFQNYNLFNEIIEFLSEPYKNRIDFVVSPESLGWILGIGMSIKLGVGFIPLRKANKLPYSKENILQNKYTDYTNKTKTLEINKNINIKNSKVIIVDEWVETGKTMNACINIIEKIGCDIIGLVTIGIDENNNTKNWIETEYVRFIGKNI